MIQHIKVGFIGAGNMTQTIVQGLVESAHISPSKIFVSNRTPRKLQKMVETFGIVPCDTNEKVIDSAEVVVIAVKPQNLFEVVEPIRSSLNPGHAVISLAAGIQLEALEKFLPNCRVGRLMPNVATSVNRGVMGFASNNDTDGSLKAIVEDLFEPLGLVVPLPEGDSFDALTVSCGSGPGFLLELMQIWQEWIEQFDIDSETARDMTIQTFLGTAEFAKQETSTSFYDLQSKVVSKKGVTEAGLRSLREREIDSVMRVCFEKAVLRGHELAKISK